MLRAPSEESEEVSQTFRFIPFEASDLVELCVRSPVTTTLDEDDIRQFSEALAAHYHMEFHQHGCSLLQAYLGSDPDRDTQRIDIPERAELPSRFSAALKRLLDQANFEPITATDLQQALTESSLFKLKLHIDFDQFEEAVLYFRGAEARTESVKIWFGLKRRDLTFINYDRVVLYVRRAADPNGDPGQTWLKLFRNVPRSDLEMLFPETSIQMRWIDKLLIGVPAVVSGGVVLTTKMGATLVVVGSFIGFWLGMRDEPVELNATAVTALFGGMAAFGAYLWKQFSTFKNRKIRFMQTLTKNLYFKNLDNNAGVIHRLIYEAEQEEFKEALLAYLFLSAEPRSQTSVALDGRIEAWLARQGEQSTDFEIEDALGKLEHLGLVTCHEGGYAAIPIEAALSRLRNLWQDFGSQRSAQASAYQDGALV